MEEKKKKYIAPEMQVIEFENADAITTTTSDNDTAFPFASYYHPEEFY